MKRGGVGRGFAGLMVAAIAAATQLAYSAPDPAAAPIEQRAAGNLITVPIAELRARANANDIAAMEELGRRLIQGTDMTKDPQAGAGWLLRAAELGSAQSAFNVGVMYERGFVVERASNKAVEWYRKAAKAGLPVAKHNLALMLRDGRGTPRDGKTAVELLKEAAREGTAASMFILGDVYDRGDVAPRDAVEALAWFAVTVEFERQVNDGRESELARSASQRVQVLQRTLTPEELARAQDRGQGEFKLIVEYLTHGKPAPSPASAPAQAALPDRPFPQSAAPQTTALAPSSVASESDSNVVAWPASPAKQVRAVQQLLFDLKLLRDKPDGALGPATRAAIRDYERMAGLKESGEPSKAVFESLRQMSSLMGGKH